MTAMSLAIAMAIQGGLMKQVVGQPTGRNGYEELVAASEFLTKERFGLFISVAFNPEAERTPENSKVFDAVHGKSLLQRRRLAVETYRPAMDFLLAASKKPIVDPRKEIAIDTLFPELAGFRDIAKLVSHAAYASFADGKPALALDYWTAAFDVFDRIGDGTLIQHLVSIACSAIVLASVEDLLFCLSDADAKRLESISATLLERPPTILRALEHELAFVERSLKDIGSKDWWSIYADDEDTNAIQKAWDRLPATDKARVITMVQDRIASTMSLLRQRYRQAEHAWVDDLPETPPASLATPQGVADALVEMSMPVFVHAGTTAARMRTQIRLLGLTASVVRFKWEHGRLPSALEEAAGKERALDPLSQLPFEFKRDGSGNFSVVSKGVKQTGEIALRYRRPLGQQAVDP